MNYLTLPASIYHVAAAARRKGKGAAAVRGEGRYALSGVLVERDEGGTASAVATDGRILLAASWADPGEPMSALVGLDVWKELGRLARTGVVRLAATAGRLHVTAEGEDSLRLLDVPTLPGVFPAWRQLVQPITPAAPAGINLTLRGRLLATLANAIEALTGEGVITATVPGDADRPIALQAEGNGLTVRGLLFRVRVQANAA